MSQTFDRMPTRRPGQKAGKTRHHQQQQKKPKNNPPPSGRHTRSNPNHIIDILNNYNRIDGEWNQAIARGHDNNKQILRNMKKVVMKKKEAAMVKTGPTSEFLEELESVRQKYPDLNAMLTNPNLYGFRKARLSGKIDQFMERLHQAAEARRAAEEAAKKAEEEERARRAEEEERARIAKKEGGGSPSTKIKVKLPNKPWYVPNIPNNKPRGWLNKLKPFATMPQWITHTVPFRKIKPPPVPHFDPYNNSSVVKVEKKVNCDTSDLDPKSAIEEWMERGFVSRYSENTPKNPIRAFKSDIVDNFMNQPNLLEKQTERAYEDSSPSRWEGEKRNTNTANPYQEKMWLFKSRMAYHKQMSMEKNGASPAEVGNQLFLHRNNQTKTQDEFLTHYHELSIHFPRTKLDSYTLIQPHRIKFHEKVWLLKASCCMLDLSNPGFIVGALCNQMIVDSLNPVVLPIYKWEVDYLTEYLHRLIPKQIPASLFEIPAYLEQKHPTYQFPLSLLFGALNYVNKFKDDSWMKHGRYPRISSMKTVQEFTYRYGELLRQTPTT